MPNGRSDGFDISRGELKKLLESLPSYAVIGVGLDFPKRVVESGAFVEKRSRGQSTSYTMTAAETLALLAKHGTALVGVEEQDYSWYIMHLGTWITVHPSSPLYESFRKCHAVWLENRAHK